MHALINKCLCNLDECPLRGLTTYDGWRAARITKNHRKVEELAVSPKARKSMTKGLKCIPEPEQVVEGFGDTADSNDIEDQPASVSIKVLVLSCILYLSSPRRGV